MFFLLITLLGVNIMLEVSRLSFIALILLSVREVKLFEEVVDIYDL